MPEVCMPPAPGRREQEIQLRRWALDSYVCFRKAHRLAKLSELLQACYFGEACEQLGAPVHVQHSMHFGVIAQLHA